MKPRRKWGVWAGVGAIAAVAAVLVLAVLAKAPPYNFMRGAVLEEVVMGANHPVDRVFFSYRLDASYDAALAGADQELFVENGWVRASGYPSPGNRRVCSFSKGDHKVLVTSNSPGAVSYVLVSRPPSFGDRLAWLMSGARKR